jgi:hypothetical protein
MAVPSGRPVAAASIALAVFALMLAGRGALVDSAPQSADPTASPLPFATFSLTASPPPVAVGSDVHYAAQVTENPTPTTTPTMGPTPEPRVPDSYWLDTSVVSHFVEPPAAGYDHAGKFYSDHNYWSFCGAGAARVALEFVGNNPGWVAGKWPLREYIEPWTSATGTRSSWKDGDLSDNGRGYMMYLAMEVQPPSFAVPGVVTFGMDIDATGGSVVGSFGTQEASVLNWEASGHQQETGYYVAHPSNGPEEIFYRTLEQAIGVDRYPALVEVLTAGFWAQKTQWTLPNWQNHGIAHWITVVGYDRSNYYYIDTCWRSTNCGLSDPDLTGLHPGTWAIPKYTLYEAMASGYGGFVGPAVK